MSDIPTLVPSHGCWVLTQAAVDNDKRFDEAVEQYTAVWRGRGHVRDDVMRKAQSALDIWHEDIVAWIDNRPHTIDPADGSLYAPDLSRHLEHGIIAWVIWSPASDSPTPDVVTLALENAHRLAREDKRSD